MVHWKGYYQLPNERMRLTVPTNRFARPNPTQQNRSQRNRSTTLNESCQECCHFLSFNTGFPDSYYKLVGTTVNSQNQAEIFKSMISGQSMYKQLSKYLCPIWNSYPQAKIIAKWYDKYYKKNIGKKSLTWLSIYPQHRFIADKESKP